MHERPDLDRAEVLAEWLAARREVVYRSAWRVLGDDGAAEDAAQDALVRLLEEPGRLAEASSPEGYLRRVAVNAALDLKRREHALKRREERKEERMREERSEPIGDAADRLALREALAALPDDLRIPLVLRYAEGLTLGEIGDALGCSGPAIHARLRKGEDRLRRALGGGPLAALPLPRLVGEAPTPPASPGLLERMAEAIAARFGGGGRAGTGASERARGRSAGASQGTSGSPDGAPRTAAPRSSAGWLGGLALVLGAAFGLALWRADLGRDGGGPGGQGDAPAARLARRGADPIPGAPLASAADLDPASARAEPPGLAAAAVRRPRAAPTLTAPVEGIVVDDRGLPIEGAFVVVRPRALGRAGASPRVEAVTDAEGRFDLLLPVAGTEGDWFAIAVGAPLHAVVEVEHRARPEPLAPALGAPPRPRAMRFELARLSPAGAVTLAGRVVDVGGAPVAGAEVAVVRVQPVVPGIRYPDPLEALGRTDAAGRYRILGDRAGAKRLVVTPPAGRGLGRAEVPLVLEPGAVDDREVVLAAGLDLRGRIVTHDGRPVPAATLLAPASADAAGQSPLLAVADADGRFVLAGLAPGAHRVHVAGAGLAADAIVILEAGAAEAMVRLKALDDEQSRVGLGAELHGEVVGPEGRLGLPPASVEVERVEDGLDADGERALLVDLLFPLGPSRARFDRDGEEAAAAARALTPRFHATGLEPGRYFVYAAGRRALVGEGGRALAARPFAGPIALAEGEVRADVRLDAAGEGAVLRGVVVERASGAPVEGAYVLLVGSGALDGRFASGRIARADAYAREGALGAPLPGSGEARTDARGRFAIDGVPPGLALRVAAVHPRFAPGASAPIEPTSPRAGARHGEALRIELAPRSADGGDDHEHDGGDDDDGGG